jgi:hypothetical protein
MQTIDLDMLATVTGGDGEGDAPSAPQAPQPQTSGQQAQGYAGACLGGAIRGGAIGGIFGGVPGAVGGALAGCATGMVMKPTPAY